MTEQMTLITQYASQVEQLQAQIAAHEAAVDDAELARERAKVDELQTRSQKVRFHPIPMLSSHPQSLRRLTRVRLFRRPKTSWRRRSSN